ncbi:hypothetical protein CALVIDRAFT_506952 [Calocera viscosa TUFC12733]|uniref:3-oxo-5-alpha-steroid 4-dehydrogenase C-terminal domain-containing protein n=1 Tax=Calocera viscosa (strain TUFC12733) TaxID=1330018 RepID=A0A167GAB5_CALVF|nr:hypothetical protein CALVIDRAFT_506952 [Calocera viscosa TUFC12733]
MQPEQAREYYHAVRRYFTILSSLVPVVYTQFDAPFGKFVDRASIWNKGFYKNWVVNTNAAFFCMEIPAPICVLTLYTWAPLSSTGPPPLRSPSTILCILFLAHYLHRAIIQPLTSPKRSPSHIIVPVIATVYQLANGSLLGTFLSSGEVDPAAWTHPAFWAWVALFVAGMVGNIYHDNLLMSLRRRTHAAAAQKGEKPHYGIPYGGLFSLVSYPNYLCEWLEWTGFAMASTVGSGFPPAYLTPPWVFLLSEVCVMLPRAVSGHGWYRQKFEDYPKDRRAVIPFLL